MSVGFEYLVEQDYTLEQLAELTKSYLEGENEWRFFKTNGRGDGQGC